MVDLYSVAQTPPQFPPGLESLRDPESVHQPDDVDTPNADYVTMSESWELIDDLMGGTRVMRASGPRWLPLEGAEEIMQYKGRVARSFLYGALRDTVAKLVAKPFSRDVKLNDEAPLPEKVALLEKDADGAGTSLTQFGRRVFKDLMLHGLTHVVVDYPRVPKPEGRLVTLQEEAAIGARPYFVHVPASNMIGWKSEKDPSTGVTELTEIRWIEDRNEPVGRYGQRRCRYVVIYTKEGYEVWKQRDLRGVKLGPDESAYEEVESGMHTLGKVPVVTAYTERTGFMTACPPLEDLAWTNLEHWQSSSDQRNILRFARVGILFATGLQEKEMKHKVVVGANRFLSSANPDADLKYVEHSGASIGAGERDLKSLEEHMEVLGLEPLLTRTDMATATASTIDANMTDCSIQSWIRSTEAMFEGAYRLAALWDGVDLDKTSPDFAVDIHNEFGLSLRASADIQNLITMRAQGLISSRTFLYEVKRRGGLSDAVDVDAELIAVANESVAMGPTTSSSFDNQSDNPSNPTDQSQDQPPAASGPAVKKQAQ